MKFQASSVPVVWGEMKLSSNGLSYMDFKLHIELNKAMDGAIKERLGIIYSYFVIYHPLILVPLLEVGYLENPQSLILIQEWRLRLPCSKPRGSTK